MKKLLGIIMVLLALVVPALAGNQPIRLISFTVNEGEGIAKVEYEKHPDAGVMTWKGDADKMWAAVTESFKGSTVAANDELLKQVALEPVQKLFAFMNAQEAKTARNLKVLDIFLEDIKNGSKDSITTIDGKLTEDSVKLRGSEYTIKDLREASKWLVRSDKAWNKFLSKSRAMDGQYYICEDCICSSQLNGPGLARHGAVIERLPNGIGKLAFRLVFTDEITLIPIQN
jgi:hypothetical protein